MELRELRAFVAAAQELHFARAADRLYISPSTMSELIRRLELELGTPLFTRTTRQVTLTAAGTELLKRAETLLELTTQAAAAVQAVAKRHDEIVRLGITPPAAPVIAPHLSRRLMATSPGVSLEVQRMWLPTLISALQAGTIDLILTCGSLGIENADFVTAEIGAEPLLVGLRADGPLAGEGPVGFDELAARRLGMQPAHLFPAWHAAQRQILHDANIDPPVVELTDTDLTARAWTRQHQPQVEWIMLIASLLANQQDTVIRPVAGHTVPFTLSWSVASARRPEVQQLIKLALELELPDGWLRPGEQISQ